MKRVIVFCFCLIIPVFSALQGDTCGQVENTPLLFLKKQELKNKDRQGRIYLGQVLTLIYPVNLFEADKNYHLQLLELTDILKTPLRDNYKLVLKGYSDSAGSRVKNIEFSLKRAKSLKNILINRYYMQDKRITAEGHGAADPAGSNETVKGRGLNLRVEVHVFGDISEAVRFVDKQEGAR